MECIYTIVFKDRGGIRQRHRLFHQSLILNLFTYVFRLTQLARVPTVYSLCSLQYVSANCFVAIMR